MKNKILTIASALFLVLVLDAALVSCRGENELPIDDTQHPIAFASVAAEQEAVTRATTLGKDFTVYGYKGMADGSNQTVFDGYTVHYTQGSANTSADNTHDYYYVGGSQTMKYWDFAATEYHFWGVYAKDHDPALATFTGDEYNVLTISGVPLRVGEPDPADDVLFSALYERRPVSTDVVQLSFKRPYAKLRIMFYTTEKIENASDNIELTEITFAPDPSAADPLVNKVYGKGNVVVTYPLPTVSCDGKAQETISVKNLSEEKANLAFQDVTLTKDAGISSNTSVTAAVDDSDHHYYYPLPMGEKNPAFTMTVCINGDTEQKTAVVPAVYMRWQANYLYTYIFKITEAGKKIEFYDVKIDPWKYGGSQEDEWRNW